MKSIIQIDGISTKPIITPYSGTTSMILNKSTKDSLPISKIIPSTFEHGVALPINKLLLNN